MTLKPPTTARPPATASATERWFQMGAELARIGRYHEAIGPLEQAMAYSVDEANVPFLRPLRSFFGLAVALGRGDIARGRRLCEEAIADGTLDAELYVNLARVYLKSGRRDLAVEAISTARAIDPQDATAASIAQQLGERRPPVFGFLDRRHPLNRVAGRLRHRWTEVEATRA